MYLIYFYYTRSALLVYLLEWFLWVSPESGILNHGFFTYFRYFPVGYFLHSNSLEYFRSDFFVFR